VGDAGALIERVLGRGDAGDDPASALVLADWAQERGDLPLVAAALDRAFGLAPGDVAVGRRRAECLAQLAVSEHGLVFRYVPAGTFLMGSPGGDADERPVHAARTAGYWLTDTPVSWAAYCELMGWEPPPNGMPKAGEEAASFALGFEHRIRMQYCETETLRAMDWHAHAQDDRIGALFPKPPRRQAERPWTWDAKPMVACSWQEAEDLGRTLSTPTVSYGLPTEAEWEKAARGGLIGKRYSWGDEAPDAARCDFDHFGEFAIRPPRELPPNGYGLHGMCGGVWEWTADTYDALAYLAARPPVPADRELPRALRGGSFTDCADAVTVSFRMALTSSDWRSDTPGGEHATPNVGFRLFRRPGTATALR